jgi:peptidylprolyl isomerase/FKBP-type peptidyl-prolyl cis-trans isomerase SlpA
MANMQKAKDGDKVRVHYTGKLKDGKVFGTSGQREPLEFTLGESNVIQGFQQAVAGMEVGESKTIQLAPDQAYGSHREDLVIEVERSVLPSNVEPEVGQSLNYRQPDGRHVPLTVTEVSQSSVKLDGNHPLAGKRLTFDLALVEIVERAS